MTTFTPWAGLAGGLLIGSSVAMWLWLYGRVTGISGTLAGAVVDRVPGEWGWRLIYLAGLVAGFLLYQFLAGHGLPGPSFEVDLQAGWPVMVLAGLLVGFGTRLGNGCTSGHGVCGLARLSARSLAATVTFMAFGIATVFVVQHLVGGLS